MTNKCRKCKETFKGLYKESLYCDDCSIDSKPEDYRYVSEN
jgi:hypothetical protein